MSDSFEMFKLTVRNTSESVFLHGSIHYLGEDVEGDLATDRVGEVEVGELLPHGLHHRLADAALLRSHVR